MSWARRGSRWVSLCAPAGLALGCTIFLAIRMGHGIWLPGFGDESMHLLGGRMLNGGGRLYDTFVDAHGPLIFMLAEAYGALFGWGAPNGARLILPALACVAAMSVVGSSALRTVHQRLLATAVFCGVLASTWHLQGLFLLNFYPVAGFLAAIGIACCLTGLWRRGESVPGAVATAGLCFALLVFTAYSFAPSVALFTAASWLAAARAGRTRMALAFAAGALCGIAGMLAWLLVHGSLVGYLAFHVAFNQVDFAKYSGATTDNFLRSLALSAESARRVHTLSIALCALSCVIFLGLNLRLRRWRGILSVLLGHAGILLLDARGLTLFQDSTFLIASTAAASVGIGAACSDLAYRRTGLMAISVLLGFCLVGVELVGRHTIDSPLGLTWAERARLPRTVILQPSNDPVFAEVRRLVPPGGRVLALVYWPDFYWAADRLPIDGFYEYLPWDADYARAPWFGRQRDLCASLAAAPPQAIAFDGWKVWDKYAPADYMPCVIRLLAERYRPWARDGRLYERK